MNHFLAISPDHVPYMNDVYNMVRKVYSRPAGDSTKDLDVNMALISGQTETTGFNLIDSQDLRCISTSLLHSRAHQYAIAKVHVFSVSVLCLGRMGDDPNQC